jgi:hypothetical protein
VTSFKFSSIFLIIFAAFLLFSVSTVQAFTTGGGIYGKCDTEGTGSCKEFWDFFLAVSSGYGIFVVEEDGGAFDDECRVGASKGVVLDRGGSLADVQQGSCSSPDGSGDNPQDVLWTKFGSISGWGFGKDVYIDSGGTFVLCDEVATYTDPNGKKFYCNGQDFFGVTTSCGDGSCNGGETCDSCEVDCDCEGPITYCGDNTVQQPNSNGKYEACDGSDLLGVLSCKS